jgi:hypothetical protein
MESFEMLLSPIEISKALGYNFIECLTDVPPLNLSGSFIEVRTRVINSEKHKDFNSLSNFRSLVSHHIPFLIVLYIEDDDLRTKIVT